MTQSEPTYKMSFNSDTSVLSIDFGSPADNDQIVQDAKAIADGLVKEVSGCEVLKVNGRASVIVSMAIAHAFAHVVQAIAGWDPKLNSYIVAVSHSVKYPVGTKLK